MRFHIGFSKYFSISILIKWLGIAFIGLVSFLGFTKVNADSVVSNFDLTSYISNSGGFSYYNNNNGTITNGFNNVLPIIAYCSQSANRNSTYCRSYQQSPYNNYYPLTENYNNVFYPILSVRNGSYNINSFKDSYFYIDHSFCNTENNNSVSFWFDYQSNNISYYNDILSNSKFNNHFGILTELSDMYYFGVQPIYQDEGPTQTWSCTIQYDSNNENGSYINDIVYCNGLPVGSSENPVVGYNIYLGSKYAYNLEPQQLVYIGTGTQDIYPSFYLKRTIDYQCLYVEPDNPDEPLFPNDGRGSSNIDYDSISNDGSSASLVIPNDNLYTDWYNDIEYPTSIYSLLMFPSTFMTSLFDYITDTSNTCSPLVINFSSITQRFGGDPYYLSIPCLRSTLQTLLGTTIIGNLTLYALADLLTAFSLFIWLGLKFYHVITEMLSGNSLSSYLRL